MKDYYTPPDLTINMPLNPINEAINGKRLVPQDCGNVFDRLIFNDMACNESEVTIDFIESDTLPVMDMFIAWQQAFAYTVQVPSQLLSIDTDDES